MKNPWHPVHGAHGRREPLRGHFALYKVLYHQIGTLLRPWLRHHHTMQFWAKMNGLVSFLVSPACVARKLEIDNCMSLPSTQRNVLNHHTSHKPAIPIRSHPTMSSYQLHPIFINFLDYNLEPESFAFFSLVWEHYWFNPTNMINPKLPKPIIQSHPTTSIPSPIMWQPQFHKPLILRRLDATHFW